MNETSIKELRVSPGEAHIRLDQFLRRRVPGLSRGAVVRMLRQQMVRLEGRVPKKGAILRVGQLVEVDSAAWETAPRPQGEVELEVIARTADLVAINKPPGVACHPLTPGETGTVVNALVARFPECGVASPDPREGGLVHRLDTGTSGVLLAARTPEVYTRLREAFTAGRIRKEYLALVQGAVEEPGEVTSALRTFPGDPRRVEVISQYSADGGKLAETRFEPRERLDDFTLVRVDCSTGQRHQVRVHLAHAGYPVAGDELYGAAPMPEAQGAFLHASRVALPDGEGEFEAGLPDGRRAILDELRNKE